MSYTVTPNITSAGWQPQTPAALRAQLLALVAAAAPGYTTLPGSLISDLSGTAIYGVSLCDSAMVELGNSLSPFGANPFLLNELGQVYGVPLGTDTNTSVYVIISGPAGWVVVPGFTVSDGTYQYIIQDGGIIGTDGATVQLFCTATVAGSWAVPAGTVTQIVTSVPGSVTLTVTNPENGTPGAGAPTEEAYRAQVLTAGLVAAQGTPNALKTLLSNVPGVQPRLVSARLVTGGWEILCGGGDPYQVGYAVFSAMADISNIIGSIMAVSGITQANPGVVTTTLNHGFTSGQVIQINGATGMTAINATNLTITVLTEVTFSVGVDTTTYGAYTGNGVVTPNLRNITTTVNSYPDAYPITFVNPPEQTVNIGLVWNTTSTNSVSPTTIAQLGAAAFVSYVNNIPVGAPMNLFELQATFQAAVASVIPTPLLTRMVFTISVNGTGVSPAAGTGIIAGDPESYFFTSLSLISITQG